MNIGDSKDRTKMELFIPFTTFILAMDFTEDEIRNFQNLMSHSVWGLNKEDLIDQFQYGPVEYIQKRYKEVKEPGIILQPTTMGVELFMWAYGLGQKQNNEFFLEATQFNNDQNIKLGQTFSTKAVNAS
jgi:hypothetical protein